MKWLSWLRYLVPAEEDLTFQAELERLSVTGLRAIAWVCIGAPLLSTLLTVAVFHQLETGIFAMVDVAVVGIGLAALAVSFWKPARPWALYIGIVVGYLVAVVNLATIFHPLHDELFPGQAMAHVPAGVLIVLLVGLASLPVRPLQMLALGAAMIATVLAMTYATGRWDELSGYSGLPLLTTIVMIAICTGLTAVVYHRRADAFRLRRLAEESFEALRDTQMKLLISENAAAQKRLAAALSHDLNTPLGALTSAFDTMVELYRRRKDEPEHSERLDAVFEDTLRSGLQSSDRLKDAVERMRRLTALDRAEEQVVDLNQLWSDAVTLVGDDLKDNVDLRLDLKPLPRVRCRPQQLSAVFSHLLRNAAAAIYEKGRIEVRSQRRSGEAVFQVADNGRGIAPDKLSRLFEPAFEVRGNTVATTNWGLFVSRGIIAQHGGQLEIESREGEGTTATVSLPLSAS